MRPMGFVAEDSQVIWKSPHWQREGEEKVSLGHREDRERVKGTNLGRSCSRNREGRIEGMIQVIQTRRPVPNSIRDLYDLTDSPSISSVYAILQESDELDSSTERKTGEGVAEGKRAERSTPKRSNDPPPPPLATPSPFLSIEAGLTMFRWLRR